MSIIEIKEEVWYTIFDTYKEMDDRMESFIKKNSSLLINIFLLLSPILDLLTGIGLHTFQTHMTFGIMIRGLFLIGVMISALFFYHKKELLVPYSIIGIYCLLYGIGILLYKDKASFFYEILGIGKTFYFPLLLITLYFLKEEIRISRSTIFSTLFLYLLLIFIPTILGIGYDSYEITKKGTIGFFNSANEISGIISILTPIMFIEIQNHKKRVIGNILIGLMYLVVILMIGTKTPLLTLGLTTGFCLSYYWIQSFRNKKYKQFAITFVILFIGIIGLLLIIPETNFYKNIETHKEFLKIEHITDIFQDEEKVDHFIFSQRLTFLHDKALLYKKSNVYQKLFGIGYRLKQKEIKMIEMDYFDIYYSHGIIGFFVFFIPSFYIVYKMIEKNESSSFEKSMVILCVLLIAFLAFFTGHVLITPSVSFISIIIILSLTTRKKKYILLISDKSTIEETATEDYQIIKRKPRNKNNKIAILWFRILNENNYDLSICSNHEISKEEAIIASSNRALMSEKIDQEFQWNLLETQKEKKAFIKEHKERTDFCYTYEDFFEPKKLIKYFKKWNKD